VEDFQTNAYRAPYTVKFSESVYVLHAFQKKSKKGIATPKADVDLIKKRLTGGTGLQNALIARRTWQMKEAVKATKARKAKAKDEKVEPSSGNVFADLGFRDAEERLLKAKLAYQIGQLIEQKGWTQTQTAARTGLDQPKVSHLLRGRLSGFSADRLFAILNRLGHSVEVRISAKERAPEKTHTRVLIA